eukprot:TRINITY_DN70949_c0_g1_i1.p1 TRINITY_DN70949_c0_g1~~TRINITY_DN70949_c0_g1_i1.p1  ORF type:complete len:403 (+),score=63.95 TRINITY_DN70949_c0_g1_i1:97-1209(+)
MTSGNPFQNTVLGFAEPSDERTNSPASFASKAGGRPVWLLRPPAKAPRAPTCALCNQPQRFLLQIYAPLEEDVVGHENAFHRVLTLAICNNATCARSERCVSVLRAQLARQNDFYGWDAEDDAAAEELLSDVCDVCGFLGERKCGGCRRFTYCGKICQLSHWKNGHKHECSAKGGSCDEKSLEGLQFKEVEIVTDVHPDMQLSDLESDDDDADDGECTPSSQLQDTQLKGTFQDADEDELPEDLFKPREGRENDATYERFCKVVSYAADQVVRYERGGRELWGSSAKRCPSVPRCERCGAGRVFEMQVMPQLLYFVCERDAPNASLRRVATRLRNDLDWLAICVYCCERSCGRGGEYVREFAWMQPPPPR